jgi:hypothetical protein
MMRSIVNADTPQLPGMGSEPRVHVPDRVYRPGLTVIQSAEPLVVASRLAAESGGELVGNLRDAQRVVKARVKALDRERAVVRARRALELAERLDAFDREADATLILRRDELESAATLGGEVAGHLTALHRKLDLLHLAYHEARRAAAALEGARSALPVELPPGADPVAIRHARDDLLAADAACAVAQQLLLEAEAAEAALAEQADPAQRSATRAETVARRRLAKSKVAARRLLVWAGSLILLALTLGGAAAAGIVSPLVGVGLAAATVPLTVELIRRASGATVVSREEVEQAEDRTIDAVHGRLARLEAAHRARGEIEHRLADALRARFVAAARWSQVAGPTLGVEDATVAIEVATELARLRPAAESAASDAERLRRSLAADLAALGAPPELEPSVALVHLERLVALHPVAGSLLDSVAEAEQRVLQREQLASLMGTYDQATLRRLANRRAVPLRRPLVVVDDGDALLIPVIADYVIDLSGSVAISIVSEHPARWAPADRPLPPPELSR